MNKKRPLFLFTLLFFFLYSWQTALPPRPPVNYVTRAWNFISQAATLGPPQGLSKLISTNANYGARGCAVQVSKNNPFVAAQIMIAVGNRLMIFAIQTKEKRAYQNPRDPYQPFRYKYWQEAISQLILADKYITKVAKNNPQQAAQLAIQIATLYYKNIPTNKSYTAYRGTYRQQAISHLHSSNSISARYYANKIKNKNQRNAILNQIQTLRKTWKL